MQSCRGSYITAFSEEGPWGLKAQGKTPAKLPHRREPHTYSRMFLVINLNIPNTSNHRHYEARRVFYESSWLFDSLKTRTSCLVVLVETNCLITFNSKLLVLMKIYRRKSLLHNLNSRNACCLSPKKNKFILLVIEYFLCAFFPHGIAFWIYLLNSAMQ